MAVVLEGGCRVSGLREGQPRREGALRIWPHVGRDSGAQAISLRVLELDAGQRASLRNDGADEALYVLEGQAGVVIEGKTYHADPDTAVYLKRGRLLELSAPGSSLTLISSRCPEPDPAPRTLGSTLPRGTEEPRDRGTEEPRNRGTGQLPSPVVRLADRPVQRTGDRWYREMVNAELGSEEMTQFVGSIPPGRAPDHFHLYEEVICILRGSGVMWAGRISTHVEVGSCIFLPREQVHCLENTGDGELRLLGVFYPAGSPAVRYGVQGSTSEVQS